MRLAVLAFAAGVAWLQWQPDLPEAAALGGIAAMGLAGAVFGPALAAVWRSSPPRLSRLRLLGPMGLFLLGVAWAGWLAHGRLSAGLDAEFEGRDVEVVGVVASLPQRAENGLRFEFDIEDSLVRVPGRVSLAWYRGWRTEEDDDLHAAPPLSAGERWRLTVRLKRPHGSLNPQAFDFEAWLFERDVRATGYVRPRGVNERIDELAWRPGYVVDRLRERVRERFGHVLGERPYAGVLTALAVGDQRAIDAELWRIFARTGTTHLMSISGLHVTMVAGLAAWLVSWLWRRSARLPLRLPAQKAAAAAGLAAAFLYCLLAGFAVPAQRTLYMLAVVALALWSGRVAAGSRVLAAALFVVLLLDPWALLAPGFWLSFGAVGLLFFVGAGRLGGTHWLAAWGRAQWAVTVGMIPALLALFQQFSLVSPLANAVAIPLVSLVVTPLALVGMLPLTEPLLLLAHGLTSALMSFLVWLADAPWAVWQQHAPPAWAVGAGIAGVAWLLLPRGFPARWLGIVALLPLLFVPPERPRPGDAWLTVLDVGQGLAVHVQTASHDLLFDTGPAFSADADSGNRIIVPYLRARGVQRLDGMVVSHADRDHSGGAESVLAELPTERLLTAVPFEHVLSAMPVPHELCADGESWQWDGVRFEVLHPMAADYRRSRKANDLSCVLKVAAEEGSLLLTSDIEAKSELALLEREGGRLAADALLVPHHGSGTSSTPEFIAAVGARTAIVPVGYRNRYGHPKPAVLERYQGLALYRTDRDGAVTVRLAEGGAVVTERAERRRYWHGR